VSVSTSMRNVGSQALLQFLTGLACTYGSQPIYIAHEPMIQTSPLRFFPSDACGSLLFLRVSGVKP
jgi:hypothetical protein